MTSDDFAHPVSREGAVATASPPSGGRDPQAESANGATKNAVPTGESKSSELLQKLRLPLWICATLLLLHAAYFGRTLIVPIVFAVFCYLTLRPVQRKLSKLGVPGPIMAVGIMATLTGAVLLVGMAAYEPMTGIIEDLPDAAREIRLKVKEFGERTNVISEATDEIAEMSESSGADQPIAVEIKQPAWTSNLTLLNGTGSVLSFLTIVVVLVYFLLAFGDDALKSVLKMLPKLSSKKRVVGTVEDMQDAVGGYLIRVTIINLCLGIAVAIAMMILDVPSPLVWGIMAATFNYVPIVGAIAGACILFVSSLLNFETTTMAFVVTGTFLTLTTIEGQFITPSILGKSMNVNPLLVVLSLIVFGWIWGFMGALLSVPLLIAGQIIFDRLHPSAEQLEAEAKASQIKDRSAATIGLTRVTVPGK